MPSVNVRLTDDQHKKLRKEAEANGRSLQREIVHRIAAPDGPAQVTAITGQGVRVESGQFGGSVKPLSKSDQATGKRDRT